MQHRATYASDKASAALLLAWIAAVSDAVGLLVRQQLGLLYDWQAYEHGGSRLDDWIGPPCCSVACPSSFLTQIKKGKIMQ